MSGMEEGNEGQVAARGSIGWVRKLPLSVFFKNLRNVFNKDELGKEIAKIAIPATLTLAADPIASLIDTAFVGHIGPVELAAVGVSIAVFNQVSKVTIFPLVSITTSFVAEEDTMRRLNEELNKTEKSQKGCSIDEQKDLETGDLLAEPADPTKLPLKPPSPSTTTTTTSKMKDRKGPGLESKKRHIPSASSAMVIGSVLGILQTLFLIATAKPLLNFMGVKSDSPMLKPAKRYLTLRSVGAPAYLLSLAMQGIFRGFKDTTTPLIATVIGDASNIALDYVFIFVLKLGVTGAAIAHVVSQYLIAFILLWKLIRAVNLLPPNTKDLKFRKFLKNGLLLLVRVIAVTFCVTLAASLAARHGTTSMAAFQVCLQVWLASSLLADGLAIAAQAILACAFAEEDFEKVTAAVSRVTQLGLVLGLGLLGALMGGLPFASKLFTKDIHVLHVIKIGIPFVALTQPLNALAFVFDGVNNGASDFAYSSYSMVLVSALTIVCLFLLSSSHGFIGIWIALSVYMCLRAFAGIFRLGTGTGPWKYLRA